MSNKVIDLTKILEDKKKTVDDGLDLIRAQVVEAGYNPEYAFDLLLYIDDLHDAFLDTMEEREEDERPVNHPDLFESVPDKEGMYDIGYEEEITKVHKLSSNEEEED
jgi:hypothetical protein